MFETSYRFLDLRSPNPIKIYLRYIGDINTDMFYSFIFIFTTRLKQINAFTRQLKERATALTSCKKSEIVLFMVTKTTTAKKN